MLYLAEVQKKTRAFGSSKAEFKLLACQRAEHSWSAVGEEIISAPDDVPYNSGALVLVDLSGSRSVQRYTEAGKQLVSILQNFSRLQEKFKTQEEEIEQWKQSLTYQSQELNRREMEMEARQEQIQDVEADFEKLEQQRQEIDATREDVARLQEDFNRKSQELEGAWAQLNGERRRFEEQQGEVQQSVGIDPDQFQPVYTLLEQFSNSGIPSVQLQEALDQANLLVGQQQETLDRYWQELEQKRQAAQQLQDEVDQGQGEADWDAWHTLQDAWFKAQSALDIQRELVQAKAAILSTLTTHLEQQDELHQALQRLAAGDGSNVDKVDVAELEQMPIDQLQSVVQDLKRDLEKNAKFVSSQEEELTLQQQDIDALKQRIAAANEYDRLQLETELSDEQESYRMLNETLVGQRRNVQEREAILRSHEIVLARRQGLPLPGSGGDTLDLKPIASQAEQVYASLSAEIETLQQQVQEIEQAIASQDAAVQQQGQEVEQQRQQILQYEHEWGAKKVAVAEQWGQVNTYQEVLQLTQETLNGFRAKLEAVGDLTAQLHTVADQQGNTLSEMTDVLNALTADQSPQLAAS